MRIKIWAAGLGVIAVLPMTAAATLLWNVDFKSNDGTMDGAVVVGAAGDVWNVSNVNPSTTPEVLTLSDSSGDAGNAIQLTFTGAAGGGFGFAGTGGNPSTLMSDGIAHGVNGGSGSSFAQITFTLSDLVPNTSYDIVAYGANDVTGRG